MKSIHVLKEQVIPLNLIFDYPVKWSKYQIFRDFIQNFYDSVSCDEFNNRFSYEITNDNVLLLKCSDVGFSYEWLIHIGASTKREECEKYAGYFGEGFKIASLCATRDYNWNVSMSSKDWSLDVIISTVEVDDKELKSLSYNVKEYTEISSETVLSIYPFYKSDLEVFKSALYSFYYPQNPLLGELLWKSDSSAIYRRSNEIKPEEYPDTYNCKGEGIIFASYQALGSFELPFVFCSHNYKLEDRDRKLFSKIDVINVVVTAVMYCSAEACFILLNKFKKYWYTYPTEKYGFKSYYSIVKWLIFNVSWSEKYKNLFKDMHPNLLAADKISRRDNVALNKRIEALNWYKHHKEEYTLVQDNFRFIGYISLEKACEKDNAFSLVRIPNEVEHKYLNVLEKCILDLFDGYFNLDNMPKYEVITNNTASVDGFANCIKLREPIINNFGLKIRYEIPIVALKIKLFNKNAFHQALSTYIHEFCHVFGGDSSARFSFALTKVLEILTYKSDRILQYKENWEEI